MIEMASIRGVRIVGALFILHSQKYISVDPTAFFARMDQSKQDKITNLPLTNIEPSPAAAPPIAACGCG